MGQNKTNPAMVMKNHIRHQAIISPIRHHNSRLYASMERQAQLQALARQNNSYLNRNNYHNSTQIALVAPKAIKILHDHRLPSQTKLWLIRVEFLRSNALARQLDSISFKYHQAQTTLAAPIPPHPFGGINIASHHAIIRRLSLTPTLGLIQNGTQQEMVMKRLQSFAPITTPSTCETSNDLHNTQWYIRIQGLYQLLFIWEQTRGYFGMDGY